MHKNCGERFSGFHRKLVWILESSWTTCCEKNDFEPLFFQFLIFRTEADNDNGHEGGGVAEDEGRKEVER